MDYKYSETVWPKKCNSLSFQIEQTSPAGANLFRIEFGNCLQCYFRSRKNITNVQRTFRRGAVYPFHRRCSFLICLLNCGDYISVSLYHPPAIAASVQIWKAKQFHQFCTILQRSAIFGKTYIVTLRELACRSAIRRPCTTVQLKLKTSIDTEALTCQINNHHRHIIL